MEDRSVPDPNKLKVDTIELGLTWTYVGNCLACGYAFFAKVTEDGDIKRHERHAPGCGLCTPRSP